MYNSLRTILLWVLALGGVAVFAWYIWAAGQVSKPDLTAPPVIKPNQLTAFGIAAGSLLATNLGAVLGIAVKPPAKPSFQALVEAQQAPWAQMGGAILYLALLLLAVIFYWRADWNENAAEVLRNSLSTLFGVLLGAMTAVFGTK
jgi:hypothetical protein